MTKFPSQLSTLWGIAERYYGNGSQWGRIWNHPTNADLRKKRGNDYRKLQPGDRVWVPQ